MSRMSPVSEDLSRYASPPPHQDYAHHRPNSCQSPAWTSSNFPNGKSLNHPGQPQGHSISRNLQQREMGPVEGYGNGGQNGGFSNGTGRNPSLMYDTGEPLGSLCSSIADAVKLKSIPTREEMKDQLVSALSSDTNIGILPGYESNGSAGAGFHGGGLRSTQSTSFLQNDPQGKQPSRLLSPVARAQAAIAKSRQEIGTTKDIFQTNHSKMAGIYRHPRGDPWVNASTPGNGCDPISVKKHKQDCYRKELESQMDERKKRKEVELKGMEEHPLGSRYNSHSLYTFAKEDPPSFQMNSKDPTKHKTPAGMRRQSKEPRGSDRDHGPRAPNQSTPVPPEVNRQQESRPERSPWLDNVQKMVTGTQGQARTNYSPPRPQPPVVQQGYPPTNPYGYPPHPQMPMFYPSPFGYPPQPPPQMPYQVYPPPMPPYQQPPLPQPSPFAQNPHFAPPERPITASPRRHPSVDHQLQRERLFGPNFRDSAPPESDPEDEDQMETAMRQHIWQTSEQLASEELKKVIFASSLQKQIFEKKKYAEMEREKEKEENDKMERSIQEYNEKMRKQVETEQKMIKRNLVRSLEVSVVEGSAEQGTKEKPTPRRTSQNKRRQPSPTAQEETVVPNEPVRAVPVNEYDEKPCKGFLKVNARRGGGGGGDGHGQSPLPNQPRSNNKTGTRTDNLRARLAAASASLPAIALAGSVQTTSLENNPDPVVVVPCPEDPPTPLLLTTNEDDSCDKGDDLIALSSIQSALTGEMRRMKRLV